MSLVDSWPPDVGYGGPTNYPSPTHIGTKMNVIDLHDRAKLQASEEVITLAHELVQRCEEDPASPVVRQIATRISNTAERLATLT